MAVPPAVSCSYPPEVIRAALQGKDAKKPSSLSSTQWKKIKPYTAKAAKVLEKQKPWDNAVPSDIAIGDRVYVNSYNKDWVSYALAEHGKTYVCTYQWRSPSEWFAEIYAIAWLNKKPAKAGTGAKLAQWLPAAA